MFHVEQEDSSQFIVYSSEMLHVEAKFGFFDLGFWFVR